MKIKRLFFLGLLLSCFTFFLTAQSNTVIDELLEKQNADFGRSSYMVLTASGLIDDNSTMEESIKYLTKHGWDMGDKEPGAYITLGEYSFILMQYFEMDSGIMYKIFPGPRYAARELYYLKLIDEDGSPGRTISGEEVIRILGRLMEWKESTL